MKINKTNFFNDTFAVFKACKKPKREADYISKSGSMYWYGTNKNGSFVIRYSDHWSSENGVKQCYSISSCWWDIRGLFESKTNILSNQKVIIKKQKYKCGKAYFDSFKERT